jgi:hypothetical protein
MNWKTCAAQKHGDIIETGFLRLVQRLPDGLYMHFRDSWGKPLKMRSGRGLSPTILLKATFFSLTGDRLQKFTL